MASNLQRSIITLHGDLLGRVGHLEEAKLFILNMPLEPDGATWGASLGGCKTYGNVELAELAEFAATQCVKLEPKEQTPIKCD